jgi:hypothetical protein
MGYTHSLKKNTLTESSEIDDDAYKRYVGDNLRRKKRNLKTLIKPVL